MVKNYNSSSKTNRTSGVLMHLTSLPGEHGIGDLGKAAYSFVDLLRKKGLNDAADDLLDSYKNNVIKFGLEVKKIMRKII